MNLKELIQSHPKKEEISIEEATVLFAGDSGDGMQLTGLRFTTTVAEEGEEVSTLPDFPAEIRAPAGTLAGVSGFQVHFGSHIKTPGDHVEVLVAMNPAALKANLNKLLPGALVLVNQDAFTESNLKKAGWEKNPLQDESFLSTYYVIEVPFKKLTLETLKDSPLITKDKERAKNMFALGIILWVFEQPLTPTIEWLKKKFAKKPEILDANIKALKAGYYYAENIEILPIRFYVKRANLEKGTYRSITGNEALAIGLIAAAELTKRELLLASYPITPASDVLHYLAGKENYRVITFQAEDEIAAICAAIGASYAGYLGATTTSGPGFSLKTEALNLAVMAELPLVVIDIQRAGPSTGMPTKTEQGDLLQALFGRHGESPVAVFAPKSPKDTFFKAIEAFYYATRYTIPVILLSDTFIANSSELWKIPNIEDLKPWDLPLIKEKNSNEPFYPYARDPKTGSRPWVELGRKGLEHRIGGLEKEHLTGHVSYDPKNHEKMVELREEKLRKMQEEIPLAQIEGEEKGELLLIGWGSTYGVLSLATEELNKRGIPTSHLHIEYLSPLPKNIKEILQKYPKRIVVENNRGQLAFYLQGKFAIPVEKITKVQGQPFFLEEVLEKIEALLKKEVG